MCRQPQIHEVWTFREDSVTCDGHLTARVDVGTGFVGKFVTNYLTPTWRRVPMFGSNYFNGSVEWLGVPDFLRNYGPPWDLNLLYLYATWGDRGNSTNPNWVVALLDILAMFLSRGIAPPVSFLFTTGWSLKTTAALRTVFGTISLWIIVRTA